MSESGRQVQDCTNIGQEMGRISFAQRDKAVNEFGKKMVRHARGNLTKGKTNASNDLYKSIKYRYEKGVLTFSMNTYGLFIDRGVTGHGRGDWKPTNPRSVARSLSGFKFKFGPVASVSADESFRQWFRYKGITPRHPDGSFMKYSTASFLFRRSVGRFGIKPRKFFTDAWERYYPDFALSLVGVTAKDVQEFVRKAIEQIKSN